MGATLPGGAGGSSAPPQAAPGVAGPAAAVAAAPVPASSNGAVPPTTLPLISTWDAALTYDVLRPGGGATPANVPQPVFVGREELLGSLVNAISEPDRRGTYLISGYRGAGKTSLVIEAGRRSMSRLQQ